MITKEEVHNLVRVVRAHVLDETYGEAIIVLREIYDRHLRGQAEGAQITTLIPFIQLVRDLYGIMGRGAARVGIFIAEGMNHRRKDSADAEDQRKYKQLGMILELGRAIFDDHGDPKKLRTVLRTEFEPETEPLAEPRRSTTVATTP